VASVVRWWSEWRRVVLGQDGFGRPGLHGNFDAGGGWRAGSVDMPVGRRECEGAVGVLGGRPAGEVFHPMMPATQDGEIDSDGASARAEGDGVVQVGTVSGLAAAGEAAGLVAGANEFGEAI
jgi:hypothetical protein